MHNIFSKTSSVTLIFDHVTWKSIGVIYYLETSIMPCLATFKIIKGSKDIKQTTSSVTLTFDHMTWKSMGSSTIPSLATFKQRSQKLLSGHRLVHRQTDRCKTICPLFPKGGIINCTLMQNSNLLTDTFTKTDLKNNSKASLHVCGHLILA